MHVQGDCAGCMFKAKEMSGAGPLCDFAIFKSLETIPDRCPVVDF